MSKSNGRKAFEDNSSASQNDGTFEARFGIHAEQWVGLGKAPQWPRSEADTASALDAEEGYALQCLGASVVMHWNELPPVLQRQLFDAAGAVVDKLDASELRGHIARLLHKYKDGDAGR